MSVLAGKIPVHDRACDRFLMGSYFPRKKRMEFKLQLVFLFRSQTWNHKLKLELHTLFYCFWVSLLILSGINNCLTAWCELTSSNPRSKADNVTISEETRRKSFSFNPDFSEASRSSISNHVSYIRLPKTPCTVTPFQTIYFPMS